MTTIYVCIGSACHLKGSYNVINSLQSLIEAHGLGENLQVEAVFCLGHCTSGVSVRIDDGDVQGIEGGDATGFFRANVLPLCNRKTHD